MATAVTPPASLAGVEALPVELARALGDPLRWRIVELLSTEQLCVAHLAEELHTAQPLVSHHLKVLRQAGLIESDRYRYWTYYRLRSAALVRLAATLGLVARSAPSGTACRRLIPLFVHRFARERLRALAQAQGVIVKDVPEVLFVCVHNAGRSQMAAALLDHHARGKVHVRSAGSAPADRINPAVAAAMDEWGIDLSKEFPKP
jgi:DNA-binding transcriptional ArsR family regulator